MTLKQIRKRLAQISQDYGLAGWLYNSFFDEVAAIPQGIDWDRWQEMSDDAKGIHLAYYRAQRTMRSWENWVNRPRQK